nr:MAG TPA: hypothetical protein [Caudoviricetes sp.]
MICCLYYIYYVHSSQEFYEQMYKNIIFFFK